MLRQPLRLFLLLCLFVIALPVCAQTERQSNPTYEALLERVKKGDATVDFTAFRMAYTETGKYDPYGPDRDARQAMFAAFRAKAYPKALESAEKILQDAYVDINSHIIASIAYKEMNKPDAAKLHSDIANALIKSILSSGDGKSAETAFTVISTNEEYVVMDVLGLKVSSQSLLNVNGHSYDKLAGTDPQTNKSVEVYFNIDKVFGWLNKSLKG